MENKSLITKPLGLHGWNKLEPVILASLILEAPMLLIGKHGSAKSYILERLSIALNLEFRNYNASLINYDDLVGIPIPIDNNTSLKYISNPNSIWDAEVVFIDEINRTKPELQNKLFPIIYEKRVQGEDLKKLKYRWAAMNPAYANSEDYEDDLDNYAGAMPLDLALVDRFPFIIHVPTWNDLSSDEQDEVLNNIEEERIDYKKINLTKYIQEGKEEYKKVIEEYKDKAKSYIKSLMDILKFKYKYISARRAKMFLASLLSIHAAKRVLNKYGANYDENLEDSFYLQILNTIPITAMLEISKIDLLILYQQAISITGDENSVIKTLMFETDPLRKITIALRNKDKLTPEILGDTITNNINDFENDYQKWAVGLITYLEIRKIADIPTVIIETLKDIIGGMISIRTGKLTYDINSKRQNYDEISRTIENAKNRNLKYLDCLNSYLRYSIEEHSFREGDLKNKKDYFDTVWEGVYGSENK